jgi:hypothetical protein
MLWCLIGFQSHGVVPDGGDSCSDGMDGVGAECANIHDFQEVDVVFLVRVYIVVLFVDWRWGLMWYRSVLVTTWGILTVTVLWWCVYDDKAVFD